MAEIPQIVYDCTDMPQNSTSTKNITKVWKHGIFYADTFILLLTYQNPKYSPVCGVCRVFFIRIIDVYVL